MSGELDDLKFRLAAEARESGAFKMMPATARAKGLCCACGLPALERCYSDAGRREYQISAMCEKCFDDCTAEPGDGEPEPEDCPACLGNHACDVHGPGPIMPNDRMRIDAAGNVTDAHGRGNL